MRGAIAAHQGHIKLTGQLGPLWVFGQKQLSRLPEFGLFLGRNCEFAVEIPIVRAAGFDFDKGDRSELMRGGAGLPHNEIQFAPPTLPAGLEDDPPLSLEPLGHK